MGGAWLVETLWDHYDYTRDTDYLRNTAYPLMKGACDFLLNWLIEDPHNPKELITAPCTSPEADYITDKGYRGSSFYGGTADLAIIRELFKNTIKGAQVLGIDQAYAERLQASLDRLRPYHIEGWEQLHGVAIALHEHLADAGCSTEVSVNLERWVGIEEIRIGST